MLAVLLNSIKLQKKRKVISEEKVQSMECCRTCLNAEDLEPLFDKEQPKKRRAAEFKTVTGLEIDSTDGLPQKICKICSKIIKLSLKLRQTAYKSQTKLLKIESQKALSHKPKPNERKKTTRKTKDTRTKLESKQLNNISKQSDISLPFSTEHKPDLDNINLDTKMKTVTKKEEVENIELPNYTFETTIQDSEWTFEDKYDASQEYDNNYDVSLEKPLKDERKATRSRRVSRLPKLPVGSKPYCDECKKGFLSEKSYRIHMKLHLDCCVCELCGKKCRNNNLLLLHKRGKHGAERIHKCAYCDYAGASREALTIHERRHTGEKPYICDHCGSGFHRRSNLIQHIAIHLPDKNFQCDICHKKVKSRKFLQIHKHSAHTGKRYLHLCPVCPRRFEKPNKVRAHLRTAHALTETPVNIIRVEVAKRGFLPVPYPECELCAKRFQSKKFLRSHKFKQHQERRYLYLCQVCKNHFRTTDSVRKHLLRAHGVSRDQQGPVFRVPIAGKRNLE